jgi:4-amino-4-deoxy-L-arabinose transferase-like glycosyltransferase
VSTLSSSKAPPRASSGWREKVIPIFLLLIFALQCIWFIRTQSLTFDEPVHIAEGLAAWRHGRFEQYNDHPPLARLLCTLPLLNSKWQVEVEQLPDSFQIARIVPDPESLAWRARSMNVPLGLLLGVLIWWETRGQFSTKAANFALALFVFTPSLIAHFSLATTDGAAALLIFAAALLVRRYRVNPSWRATAITGTVLGLMLLAKFSTLPMFLLAIALLLVLDRERIAINPLQWNWAKCAATIVIALLVIWAGYFFHVSRLTIRGGVLTATHPHWNSALVKPTRSGLNLSIPVPAGEYVAGFRDLVFHNAHGQRAFFLGQVSLRGGWKSYYPVTILLKWPLLLLVSSLAGLIVGVRRAIRFRPGSWIAFLFPALYFTLALFSHFNIGERHILPLYPFALLLAAGFADWLLSKRAGTLVMGCILVLNAADCLRYAPGWLSYMNPLVRPARSYRLLSDSNLDWGQGLLALRAYQQQHPGERISLAYFGSVDPQIYGIRAQKLEENGHLSGTVVVSATALSGQYLNNPTSYHWLLQYKPKQILDHSMYVFEVK